jgi:hypothetical protein
LLFLATHWDILPNYGRRDFPQRTAFTAQLQSRPLVGVSNEEPA